MLNVLNFPSQAAGTAPRLVLVHGFTQNAEVWAPLAELLAPKFSVVAVDLPGHGRTAAAYDQASLSDAAKFVTEAGGPAAYFGYSLGARVLLHAMIESPDAIKCAVLAGPKAGFRDPIERDARTVADNRVADRIQALGDERLHEFMDDWLAQSFNDQLNEAGKAREARLNNRAVGLAESLRHTGSGVQVPIWNELSVIETPTLLLKAEDELPSVEAEIHDIKEAIGDNATMSVAPGVGHAGPFQNPRLYAELITNFISRV